MSFKMDIGKQSAGGIEDPDKGELAVLVDEWCEGVESAARNHCDDLNGSKIEFYRENISVAVKAENVAAIDCIMQAMVERRDRMDTSLAGVYDMVLDNLERRREKMHRTHGK
jgi:hypothetical protein